MQNNQNLIDYHTCNYLPFYGQYLPMFNKLNFDIPANNQLKVPKVNEIVYSSNRVLANHIELKFVLI